MKLQDLNITKASNVINDRKFNLHFNEKHESEENVKMADKTRRDRLLMKMEMKAGLRG